jgi:uncharacterized membrane protein
MPSTLLNVAAKSAVGSDSTAGRLTDYAPRIRSNVSDLERWISLALGGGLVACGLSGRKTEWISTALGGYLLYRAATGNCPLMQAIGVSTAGPSGEEAVIPAGAGCRVELVETINKPKDELYRFWRRFDNLPKFMKHLKEVRDLGGDKTRWVADAPLGLSVEWDAEIVEDRPGEVISWKSVDGSDVDTAGSVRFRPAPGGRGTEVRVNLKYQPPAGKLGGAVAKLFGKDPEAQIREDLSRFKSLMETGEIASIRGQPSGRR